MHNIHVKSGLYLLYNRLSCKNYGVLMSIYLTILDTNTYSFILGFNIGT